jgi:hypothetical protein
VKLFVRLAEVPRAVFFRHSSVAAFLVSPFCPHFPRVRTFGDFLQAVVFQSHVKAFIPIYPNTLPTVPKPSRAGRTASLVFRNLPASRSAITRLENR